VPWLFIFDDFICILHFSPTMKTEGNFTLMTGLPPFAEQGRYYCTQGL